MKCTPSRTLYAQLNHCVTAFGKRLLKTWLARPLFHVESIKERQEAVASLRVTFFYVADISYPLLISAEFLSHFFGTLWLLVSFVKTQGCSP